MDTLFTTIQYVWSLLKGTPWWVYAIFVYLLWVGFDARKTRNIKLPILFIMPLIFLVLQYSFLSASFKIILLFLSVFVATFILSWFWHKRKKITFHPEQKEITLYGSWETFILVMGIFFVKYVFGFLDNELSEIALKYQGVNILFSAMITGFAWGRTLCYFYRFKRHQYLFSLHK